MATQTSPTVEPLGVSTSETPPPTRQRLLSLDVFRGLTVAAMLLVNNPGSWDAIYPPLEHAKWHGWTPTDLIFPFFLFIVGITTHLSLSSRLARGDDESAIRRQIIRRAALIFLIGFLISGEPFVQWGMAGHPIGERFVTRMLQWRIMGVLQRIGIAYLCAALLTWRASVKRIVITVAVILVGYFIVMTALPVPGTGTIGYLSLGNGATTMAGWVDRQLLDWTRFGLGNHLWINSLTWDPEGILSTLGAIATAMLGVLAGRWLSSDRSLEERLNGLFAAGALGMVAGLVWNWVFPINKSLWTSSYVLFTGGMAAVTLATIMWIVDVRGKRGWTKPAVVYGSNPLVAFAGSELMARWIYTVFTVNYHGQTTSVEDAIYQSVFASWLPPVNASLAFAIAFVLFWYAVLYVLHRKNIYVKI